ncbi:MAG: hypothetical protein V4448_02650 [Pseudomonadota bacterium]
MIKDISQLCRSYAQACAQNVGITFGDNYEEASNGRSSLLDVVSADMGLVVFKCLLENRWEKYSVTLYDESLLTHIDRT